MFEKGPPVVLGFKFGLMKYGMNVIHHVDLVFILPLDAIESLSPESPFLDGFHASHHHNRHVGWYSAALKRGAVTILWSVQRFIVISK